MIGQVSARGGRERRGRAIPVRVAMAVLVVGMVVGRGHDARASVVRLHAAGDCVQASDVTDQVDTLLGRPLSAVEGVDFEIELAPDTGGKWRLRVDTIDRLERRTRALVGKSCAELADAAAVAIAMSIRSSAAGDGDGANAAGAGGDDPRARPAPPPGPRPATGPPASPEPPAPAVVAVAPPPVTVRGSLTLAVVADVGALPGAAPGAALEAALDVGSLRIIGLGTLFASQNARVGNIGGDFRLVFGAALACYTQVIGHLTALGCAGGEIGRLSGEGLGVDVPRLGSALWLAPRADLGLAIPMTSKLMLGLRLGAAVPLSRPRFVADENVPVHRSGRVSGRATLGLEVDF